MDDKVLRHISCYEENYNETYKYEPISCVPEESICSYPSPTVAATYKHEPPSSVPEESVCSVPSPACCCLPERWP